MNNKQNGGLSGLANDHHLLFFALSPEEFGTLITDSIVTEILKVSINATKCITLPIKDSIQNWNKLNIPILETLNEKIRSVKLSKSNIVIINENTIADIFQKNNLSTELVYRLRENSNSFRTLQSENGQYFKRSKIYGEINMLKTSNANQTIISGTFGNYNDYVINFNVLDAFIKEQVKGLNKSSNLQSQNKKINYILFIKKNVSSADQLELALMVNYNNEEIQFEFLNPM